MGTTISLVQTINHSWTTEVTSYRLLDFHFASYMLWSRIEPLNCEPSSHYSFALDSTITFLLSQSNPWSPSMSEKWYLPWPHITSCSTSSFIFTLLQSLISLVAYAPSYSCYSLSTNLCWLIPVFPSVILPNRPSFSDYRERSSIHLPPHSTLFPTSLHFFFLALITIWDIISLSFSLKSGSFPSGCILGA
jgi:hypothetical protein